MGVVYLLETSNRNRAGISFLESTSTHCNGVDIAPRGLVFARACEL
jgi:hypothetical protein